MNILPTALKMVRIFVVVICMTMTSAIFQDGLYNDSGRDLSSSDFFNETSSARFLKATDDAAMQKMSSMLYPMYRRGSATPQAMMTALGVVNGMIPVDVTASDDVQDLMKDLETIGFKITAYFESMVSGRLPVSSLGKIGTLDSVHFVHVPNFETNAGSVWSEGVEALKVDLVRSKFSVDGKGIKIGVISDSYNFFKEAAKDIATGDLPAEGVQDIGPQLQPDDKPKDEGRAMLQVIHDVAPGAQLFFHTSGTGSCDYAVGIMALAEKGCNIIVDDITLWGLPLFQDSIVAHAVDKVYSMGVAYFCSAGNYGQQSYSGAFADSGKSFRGGKVHNFNPSHPVEPPDSRVLDLMPIVLENRPIVRILFSWDQPSAMEGRRSEACKSDLDLYIFDPDTSTSIPLDCTGQPSSFSGCLGGTDFNVGMYAVELLLVNVTRIFELSKQSGNTKQFGLKIVHKTGPLPGRMQIVIQSGSFLRFQTNSGTVFGHHIARGAAAVGAAYSKATPAFGSKSIELELFSSGGGIPILFDTNGVALQEPEIRKQPRFVGPDGVSNTFFGAVSPAFKYPLFYGTSAAAPHVAAVAALMLERNPSLSPDDIYNILQDTAIDMNEFAGRTSEGFDFGSGYGFVDAFAAVEKSTSKKNKKKKGKGTGGASKNTKNTNKLKKGEAKKL